MSELAQLDHTVINVHYDMDAAAARYADMGFHLTERGYHTLGSINHLMMFGTDYVELIGLPAGDAAPGRADIAQAPKGINGLVFKTSDVDATHAHLQAIGFAGDPPKAFSRPVTVSDGTFDAKFRTVHVRSDVFPGGRVYFCEHGTPDLVWRPEWQSHANGALAMPEFVVAAREPEAQAEAFAKLLEVDMTGGNGDCRVAYREGHLSILSPAVYRARYGDLACEMGDRAEIFGALVIRSASLDAVRNLTDLPIDDRGDRVIVRDPDFDAVLEFVAA